MQDRTDLQHGRRASPRCHGGAWLARYATDPVDEADGRLVGLALDGKAMRGSRADSAAIHLLPAALHACQTVIAQRQVAAQSNEIPAFALLSDRIDLHGVVTADATPTQRAHAEHVIAIGGHYLLAVKGNQKKLRKQLRHLPWPQIPLKAAQSEPCTAAARSVS